jgi:hypothetical protein
MSISEYILALMSIVVGLAMTQLLSGAAEIAQHAKPVRTYWIHTAWMVNLFVTLIHFWWWEFGLMQIEDWTFLPYAFVICYAVLLYFLVALLVPQHLSEQADLKEYFYSHRGWFFGTMALVQVVDFGDTFVKGWAYFIGWVRNIYPNLVIRAVCDLIGSETSFHGYGRPLNQLPLPECVIYASVKASNDIPPPNAGRKHQTSAEGEIRIKRDFRGPLRQHQSGPPRRLSARQKTGPRGSPASQERRRSRRET